jgi:hypothetical protein
MAQTPDLQIEIIYPNNRRETKTLDASKGIANIGSHPANEIVLLGEGITEFHAVLDFRQTPYKYLLLNGQQPVAQMSFVQPGGKLAIGGYWLLLNSGQLPPPIEPSNIAGTARLEQIKTNNPDSGEKFYIGTNLNSKPAPPPPSKPDNDIRIDLTERDQWVNPSQTATWTLVVTNVGSRTARFVVDLFGIDESQKERKLEPDDEATIQIQPVQFNLNNQVSQTITVKITPPRTKESHAGWYRFRVVVSSPDYPKSKDKQVSVELALRIRTHDAYEIESPTPKSITLRFRGRSKKDIVLPIFNFGNRVLPLTVTGNDPERSLQIELRFNDKPPAIGVLQWDLPVNVKQLNDAEEQNITARIRALQSYWFGWKPRKTELQFTVISEDDRRRQYQPVLVEHRPLIDPLRTFLTFLVILFLILFGLRASIYEFGPNPANPSPSYKAGENIALTWKSFLSFPPEKVEMQAFHNSMADPVVELSPEQIQQKMRVVQAGEPTTYTIIAYGKWRDWLSWIPSYPVTATDAIKTPIAAVTPANNSIRFSPVLTESVIAGNPVELHWIGPSTVITYMVKSDDQTESAIGATPTGEITEGKFSDSPQKNITYTITGRSPYLPSISTALAITVQQPDPIIDLFQVEPTLYAPGDTVTVTWKVSGKGESEVKLNGTPVAYPAGTKQIAILPSDPIGTATFELSAIYSGTATQVFTTSVAAATPTPTATGVKPPKINSFKADPVETLLDGSVKFTWDVEIVETPDPSVTGEISIYPIIGTVDPKDERTIPMQTPGLREFILKAKAIAPLSTAIATRKIKVNVLVPTATFTPTPIPPAQGTLKVVTTGNDQVNTLGNDQYQVAINAFVGLQWEITNKIDGKTKTEIKDLSGAILSSDGASGTVEVQVKRDSQYQLLATNDPAQPLQQLQTIFVTIRVPPTPEAVFNVNVAITDGIGVQTPAKITWSLPPESIDRIVGFRVYRSDSSTPSFDRLADEGTLDKTKREWVDNNLPTCGKTYYVTVAYDTYDEDGEKVRTETSASENSVATPLCPSQ